MKPSLMYLGLLIFTSPLIAQTAIFNGSAAVNTRSMVWFTFYTSEGNNWVVGRFTAPDSINAYIVDDDGLTNLRGGASFQQYFESGNVVVANINSRLPVGRFYLVFVNRNIISSKTVTGYVGLLPERSSNPDNNYQTASVVDDPFRCTVKRGGANLILNSGTVRFLTTGARVQLLGLKGKYSAVATISYRGRILSNRIVCN